MTVIYFTDGALIDDVAIRRTLVRIPEVIALLKKSQEEFIAVDLFLAMNEEAVYNMLNFHQKTHLKDLVQEALYNRWLSQGRKPDLIIKRKNYPHLCQLKDVFVRLATLDVLNVVTIGPGFDEIQTLADQCKMRSKEKVTDVITIDPQLNWFWQDVRNQIQLHS